MKYVILIVFWIISVSLYFHFLPTFEKVESMAKLYESVEKNKWKKQLDIESIQTMDIEKFVEHAEVIEEEILFDISNLKLLSGDFDWAIAILKQKSTLNYKDYFNLWNIYLLKSMKELTWSIDSVVQAIVNYEKAKEIIELYTNDVYNDNWNGTIQHNLDIAHSWKQILELRQCLDFFEIMIKKTDEILEKIEKVKEKMKQQIQYLNELQKLFSDKYLQTCIQWFKDDINKNIKWLNNSKKFFEKIKDALKYQSKQYIANPTQCLIQQEYLKTEYDKSLDDSKNYFENFLHTYNQLSKIFKSKSKWWLEQLCRKKHKLSTKQIAKNKKMEDAFEKLKKLIEEPQQQKPKQEEQKNEWEEKILKPTDPNKKII